MAEPTRPHMKVLKIDDTEYWDKEFVKKTGRILSVYVFDSNQHVYAASLTPSYELYSLDSQAEQRLEEETYEQFVEADADRDPVTYMTAYSVDALPQIEAGDFAQGVIDLGESEERYDEIEDMDEFMQDVIEELQDNPV